MSRARCIMAGAILLVAAATASADPIIIVVDGRSVFAAATLTDASGTSRANNFQQQQDTLSTTGNASTARSSATSTATLTGSLSDPMHWSGFGTVQASWTAADMADIFLGSRFNVSFLVTEPVFYHFTGSFTSSSSNIPGVPFQGGAQAQAGASLFARRSPPDEPGHSTPIFGGLGPLTGLLIPDEYFFSADAFGFAVTRSGGSTGDLHGAFNFTFDLTPAGSAAPTPEPASVLLLGTGIAGIFRLRRRTRPREITRSIVGRTVR